MFCSLDELVVLLLCLLQCSTGHFRNTCDLPYYLIQYTSTQPCDKTLDKGHRPSASSVEHSQRVYNDYCQRKSFQECLQNLRHCFGDLSLSKATVVR